MKSNVTEFQFPTTDLSYLRLILRMPALIFTTVKTIINPAHVEICFVIRLTG